MIVLMGERERMLKSENDLLSSMPKRKRDAGKNEARVMKG